VTLNYGSQRGHQPRATEYATEIFRSGIANQARLVTNLPNCDDSRKGPPREQRRKRTPSECRK